ncbi:hypothetical protein [Bradyrhizobium diazoefficiens]|uniref:hypothetical protein n=1 Tax=Bradyrhizobium diazoefficiens TaxID=1355477 RepID=UPI0027150D42|nr:hypothetical protein [Bradyrhizobium diazoefficiens]WLB34844.1 hypothetical protein QIH78_25520 [Bradyrhizobium diazoefficiens]BCF44577.1 hypothetical protein XF16B_50670 [Bradyrhizobium diazoefficiens]BCF70723.1 hypothetical protein XF19B_50760 [Bradyrhizobium diazoefficiens]
MAHQNELTEIALSELKAHGIRGHIRDTNGGHIEISWQVVPEKEVRRIIVAKSTSDWRSRMNTRADVRRFLRADNISLKMSTQPKKQTQLQAEKAMSLPQPDVLPIPDQIAAMRGEMSDLSELVMRLYKIVAGVRDNIASYVPKPVEAAPKPTSSRSVKLVEYLAHDRWVTIDTLPRDTGLTAEQIKLKLQYLKNHDEVEIFRGQAKLKPPKPREAAPKKLHWKTAQKMAREAAAAKEATTPARKDAKHGKTAKGALRAA